MRSATLWTAGALFALLLAGCAKQAPQTGSTDPAAESTPGTPAADSTDSAAIATTPVNFTAGEEVTLAVPEMHCQFGCYPAVKETLEGLDGVQTVDLVPQKSEDELNDRRVIVKLDGDLSSQTAIKALDEAGFPGSSIDGKQ
jgi:copper chaperone CopZ